MPTHIPNNAVVKIGAVATTRRPTARLGNSFAKAILPVGFSAVSSSCTLLLAQSEVVE